MSPPRALTALVQMDLGVVTSLGLFSLRLRSPAPTLSTGDATSSRLQA